MEKTVELLREVQKLSGTDLKTVNARRTAMLLVRKFERKTPKRNSKDE